jgi:thymidylate synthase (FAD)
MEMSDKNWKSVGERVINKMKHESVAEHVNLTFKLTNFSRLDLQEMSRHRVTSPTVESTRFCLKKIFKEKEVENLYVIPTLALQPEHIDEWIKDLIEVNSLLLEKISKWDKLGYKNDVLKYWLLESLRTKSQITINVRSLFNWLNLRLGNEQNDPHFEIQYVSQLMLKEVLKTDIGWLFKKFENRL